MLRAQDSSFPFHLRVPRLDWTRRGERLGGKIIDRGRWGQSLIGPTNETARVPKIPEFEKPDLRRPSPARACYLTSPTVAANCLVNPTHDTL